MYYEANTAENQYVYNIYIYISKYVLTMHIISVNMGV